MISIRKSNNFEQKTILDKGFSRVFRELRILDSKIHKKNGFWIFKKHIYSKKTLFDSQHHSKIYAYTESIGNIVLSWNNYGKLTRKGRKIYNSKSQEINLELERVNNKIANRDPTWWESIEHIFGSFILAIRNNLPFIVLGFLSTAGEFIPPLRYLAGFFPRLPKLLSQEYRR